MSGTSRSLQYRADCRESAYQDAEDAERKSELNEKSPLLHHAPSRIPKEYRCLFALVLLMPLMGLCWVSCPVVRLAVCVSVDSSAVGTSDPLASTGRTRTFALIPPPPVPAAPL